MAKKKPKVSKKKAAPRKAAQARRPTAAKAAIGLGSPVVFHSAEGPRAAVIHGFGEDGGVNLTLFTDNGVLVKLNVKQGAGEVGTWARGA